MWPTYHLFNNVSRDNAGQLQMEGLNDANGVLEYHGIFHAFVQGGPGPRFEVLWEEPDFCGYQSGQNVHKTALWATYTQCHTVARLWRVHDDHA